MMRHSKSRRLRWRGSQQHPLRWRVTCGSRERLLRYLAVCILAGFVTLPAAAPVTIDSWQISAGSDHWDLDSAGKPTQFYIAGVGDLALSGDALKCQIEIASQNASWDGEDLDLAESIAGAFLLRYRPDASSWLLQAGAATPASGGDATSGERELLRMLAEPVLDFADPDPARGWRFVGGATRGWALRRGLTVAAGLSGEIATTFEPAPGLRFDPCDRMIGMIGIERELGTTRAHARLAVALEGSESARDMTVRESRRVASMDVAAQRAFGSLLGGMQLAYAHAGHSDYSDPGDFGDFATAGPGEAFEMAGEISAPLLVIQRITPSLRVGYLRYRPHDLDYADGWSMKIMPGVEHVTTSRVVAIAAGWRTGTARFVDGARSDLSGWSIEMSYSWRATGGAKEES